MAMAVLDVDYLSAYLDVPQQNLTTVIDEPTVELVRSILQAVTAKAHEHEELASDKLRVDIELENAVRSSETRIEGLRATVEKAQKQVEEVRKKLKEEENSRSTLESQLQTLKSSSTTSTSAVETLRARITSLEAANRDTVAILESKTTVNDNLAKDLQSQHQKGLELSQQISSLQQAVQNANSAISSAKFREQSLEQEITLVKRNNEWFENELKTKSADALKYRKEKGARIAELQRQNEEATSNLEALKKTEQALRNRVDELQKKAEDSLSKIQQLQEKSAQEQENSRQELATAQRLNLLQTQQTETHRNRLREVEANLERIKDDAAEEIGKLQQKVEGYEQQLEQAGNREAELEAEVDRLEALVSSQPRPGSIPSTPRQGLNGSMIGRLGSPGQFGTPGSALSKSSITATQAIEDLYKVKGQLATEKREHQRLKDAFDDNYATLERKIEEWGEVEAENERLQQEVVEMSKFVDQVGKERDRAKKDARKAEGDASTAQAEANIFRQQLRDLSAQIKMLLCDIDARERGLEALSAAEREQLERLARGEVGEDAFDGLTDTDRLISQRLTVFRNISELQEKNQELLKITRQLGAQMESEEALAAKDQAVKDHEEVQRLETQVEKYKDELKSMLTRSESYMKERDMFRRMLQHRGQLPPPSDLASIFGQSIDGTQNGLSQSIEQTPGSRENTSALALRELQVQFDDYRREQDIDRNALKEQADNLAREKVSLQAEIAKVSSQLTHANERYELFQSNYSLLQNENSELQKRSNALSENAAKHDIRTQQVAEDLVEAKTLVESMRNEIANLKAEKKLWKDIQDRLNQDNEALMNERTRLNNLVANQQTLQNERELSDSETRRRLQSQMEALESELSTTKRKLNEELEDSKKAQLRKEYDSQQNQKRIDDLASSLSQVREELVAAKTIRDHLQARVNELTIELKSAEERVELLQPRPTPRSGTQGAAASGTNGDVPDEDFSREQELAIEVSELKRDLELSKSELESAKAQMEQYKSISQASEEELQSLNATQDQYREEMDRIVEEKDAKIRELQQRVDDISAELTNTNDELTSLRNRQSEIARQYEEDKTFLEAEISRLKDEDERHASAAQFHQQDLRAQAAIATKAQQDYEHELVKHAEAAKQLQDLRVEHNRLKTASATLKAEAESAKVALSQNESSWDERREQFEQELKELRTRRDDLNAQNKVLHQQLENVGSQISALQQSRTTSADDQAPESTSDRTLAGLQELNTFLRREKEIVEVQYELKVQEAKRLQQQLEYSQSQLDESKLKLDQERRLHADGSRSSAAHKDLMQKLEELNLFRESSITLRNEAREAQTQLAVKTKRVEELLEQIRPLRTKIQELKHNKEAMDGEIRILQEDRDRWQKRTQDIMSKYDRIDPVEMEQLKENIEALKTERDSLLAEKQPMEKRIQSLEAEKASWSQTRQKLIDSAKERNRTQMKENKERTAERDAAIQEKETLQKQLSGLQQELMVAVREKEAARFQVTTLNKELGAIKTERDRALSVIAQSPKVVPPTSSPSQPRDPVVDQQLERLQKELDTVKQEKQSLESELKKLRDQLAKTNSERDAAIAEVAEVRSKQASQVNDGTTENDHEEGQINESPNVGLLDEERRMLEERIAAAEAKAKESEANAALITEQMETTLKNRSEKMKASLNQRLAQSKEQQKAELQAEFDLKLEQEKQRLLTESKAAATPLKVSTDQSRPSEAPLASATPGTPSQDRSRQDTSLANLSETEIRRFIESSDVAKSIVRHNIQQRLASETQKLHDEHSKSLAQTLDKAENAKSQAVMMETKKSALKINMAENKAKSAAGKLEIVDKAAQETPQRPVVEVWEEVKAYRLPAAPPAAAKPTEAPTPSNGTANQTSMPAEIKTEVPPAVAESRPNSSGMVAPVNGPLAAAAAATAQHVQQSNIPHAPHGNNNILRSSIPQPRGGSNMTNRGRGGPQLYQLRGSGTFGRGRGGNGQGQRGNLNPSAAPYSPTGPSGTKRPRDEGSMGGQQSHAGKRPRGGGPSPNN